VNRIDRAMKIRTGVFMKRLNLVILAFFILSAFPLNLGAFTKGACKPDVKKFCPGMGFDKPKIEKCIYEHRDEVSAACEANIEEKEAERASKSLGS